MTKDDREKPCHRPDGAPASVRMLRREHAEDCTDTRECTGCVPCPKRHCLLCKREHLETELQTCPYCVGQMRGDLKEIEELTALLPDQAAEGVTEGKLIAAAPIPGGEAMVMLAPGSLGTQADDHEHESWADPMPPLTLLESWENDWRHMRGQPAAGKSTIVGCRSYLERHLSWASQHHDAIEDFAREITSCRQRLAADLHASEKAAVKAVACLSCDTLLDREYRDPKPCRCWRRAEAMAKHEPAQVIYRRLILNFPEEHVDCDSGGLQDPHPLVGWHCLRCRRDYSPTEYQRALQQQNNEIELRTGDYLAEELQVQPALLRAWASRGKIRRYGRDAEGRVLYRADAVRDYARTRTPERHAG